MKKRTRAAAAAPRNTGGRPRLYGEPLTETLTARLMTDEQGVAIGDWCRTHKISPVTLFREVALKRAGVPELGRGLKDNEPGVRECTLNAAIIFPIKMSPAQADAVRAHCASKGLQPAVWLREVVLEHIKRTDLGMRGTLAQL